MGRRDRGGFGGQHANRVSFCDARCYGRFVLYSSARRECLKKHSNIASLLWLLLLALSTLCKCPWGYAPQ